MGHCSGQARDEDRTEAHLETEKELEGQLPSLSNDRLLSMLEETASLPVTYKLSTTISPPLPNTWEEVILLQMCSS